MEQKSAALQSSLDKQNNCIKDNTKQKLKNLKEGADGRQPSGFSASRHGLKTKQGTLKIDRAHRALGPPKENIYRPVIIKLHNLNGSLLWLRRKAYQGSRIYILSIGPSKGSQASVQRGLRMADPGRNTVPNALPSQLMLHFQWRGARLQKSM